MEEENDIKKRWIQCSVIGFLIAFAISMFVMEGQQISLIQGNSYYLSSVSVFLETIFEPVKGCIIYSIVAEVICQIVFWMIEFIMPKEKKITQKTLTIPIVSNIISFIIVAFVIISNIHIIF